MRRRNLLLALLCVTSACATTAPKTGPVVDKVKIEGAEKVPAREVKAKILTTESSFLSFLPWIEKEHFDPTAWQADLRRVERFYQAKGFYQARVVDEEIKDEGKDKVSLLMRVKEGEPTLVDEITVEGLDELPPEHREKALEDFPLKKGDVFVEEKWTGLKEAVQGRLRELGYAEATAEGEVKVDLATRKATAELNVTPGQRYKFGNLFAATDPRPVVAPKRIIEQAEGAIKKGDWYSESALAEAQARIFKMGVFGGVKVNRGAPDRESGTVPIVIDVRESKFHTLRAGPGVGVDAYSNSARVVAEYTDRNFLGGLRRLTVSGRAGWTFIPGIIGVATRTNSARNGPTGALRAELEQPRFIFRDVRGQVALEGEQGIEPAYDFTAGRGRVALTWQPLPSVAFTGSYNAEVYFLRSGDPSFRDVSSLGFGCTGLCFLSYLEQVAEWDRRNDRNDPRHGTYTSLAFQESVGGGFKYFRVLADLRGYKSFLADDRLTFSGKIRFGTLISSQESPIVARFFSGGSFMRGFNGRRLSPMLFLPRVYDLGNSRTADRDSEALAKANAIPPESPSGQVVPIGGNGLFEGSFEARYAFPNNIVLATFLDMGFVTSEALPVNNFFANNFYALGLGVRYLTVVGPIRVDFAYRLPFGPALPLSIANSPTIQCNAAGVCTSTLPEGQFLANQQSYDDRSAGCFGIGSKTRTFNEPRGSGNPDDPCVIHISIGQAF